MASEGSRAYSQDPVIGSYPEPDMCSPQLLILFIKNLL
jgi:hypothetical protein